MKLPKELLEKIITLRDLRQAIHAIRTQNLKKDEQPKPEAEGSYGHYKRRYLSGELPSSHVPEKFMNQIKEEDQVRPEDEKTQKVLPAEQKPYGLKHLGIKRSYGQVIHMFGVPGHNEHYELKVNKMSPKIEYTSKLVNSETGGTVARSPRIHSNIKDAAVEIVNHHNNKRWSA